MKRLVISCLLALLCATGLYAQSTSVTLNVVDAGAQQWANGTYSIVFLPNSQFPGATYSWTGGAFDPTHVYTGALDGSGSATFSIPSNSAISPTGTNWALTVCPFATSPCFSNTVSFNGTTQTLNFTPHAISVNAAPGTIAYTDAEVKAGLGGTYYNVLQQLLRICIVSSGGLCSSWATVGGGSGPGGTPRLDQVIDPNISKTFNLGGTTLAFISGTVDFSFLTSPIKLPVIASCATASNGQICYDTTLGNWKFFNTADAIVPTLLASGTYTNNDVLGISNAGGQLTLTDLGPINGASGNSFIRVTTTNILDGDTICWDGGTTSWINCTPGVPPITITATSYTVDCSTDRGSYFLFTAATAIAVTLPQASTSGACDANFFFFVRAINATVTVTPTVSTIDDGGGALATLTVPPGYGFTITSDDIIYTARGGPYREGSNPLMSVEGFDVRTAGGYDWQAPNNASPGTILHKAVCDDGTGKLQTCAFATAATNNVLGSAVTGIGAAPGTTGNTGVCTIGFCPYIFDNTATANHFAQSSTTVNGDLTDVGTTAPTNGQSYWYVFTGNSGAGTEAVIRNIAASELNVAGISGGNGKSIQININGTAVTKSILNLNGTTPSADANNQLLTWKFSSASNTTSASVEVPLATTGQAGIVQLTGGLGGTSAAPTLHSNHAIGFSIYNSAGLASGTTEASYALIPDIPFACTINSYALGLAPSGTVTVKFWKVAGGTAIPAVGNSISTSGVSISSGTRIQSGTLSDFTTTAVAAHDQIVMDITAVATATLVTGVLSCQE